MQLQGLKSMATRYFLLSTVNPKNPYGSHHPVVFAFSIPFSHPHASP